MTPRRHAEFILPLADELLAAAGITPLQLDGVAFGCGPGSFTGLRLACGIAQGIAFAANIPVLPISSLATLAQAASMEAGASQVLAAIDARMKEVYWGCYRLNKLGLMQLIGEEIVCAPTQVKVPTEEDEGSWYGVGSGWATYAELLQQRVGRSIDHSQAQRYPQAQAMLPLAVAKFEQQQWLSAEEAMPVYLRNQVVTLD